MNKYFLLFALMCFSTLPAFAQSRIPGPGGASGSCVSGPNWSHTQATASATWSTGLTVTVTLTNNPGTGHLVMIGVADGAIATRSVTVKDGNNNAYTVTPKSPSNANLSNAGEASIAYLLSAPANASKTITVTWSGAIVAGEVWADEFTDSNNCAQSLDNDAVGNGVGTALNTPSITPATSNELFYSVVTVQNTISSINSPWTGNIAASGADAAYVLNVSSATALNSTQSSSGGYDSIEAAIK